MQTSSSNANTFLGSIPEDILSLIFTEYLHEPNTNYHVIVSHTCRAFRLLALNIPSLWTCLNTHMSKDEVDTYLSRCGQKNLTISFLRPLSRPQLEGWWNFVLRVRLLSHRWREFIFDIGDFNGRQKLYRSLHKRLYKCEFPNLKSVSIRIQREFTWDPMVEEYASIALPPYFYAMWNVPRLQTLILTNSIKPFNSCSSLTKLHITLDETKGVFQTLKIAKIINMLSAVPSLREFRFTNRITLRPGGDVQTVHVNMSSLNLLFLENSCGNSWTQAAFQDLLTSLYMPNLVQYRCKIAPTWHRPNDAQAMQLKQFLSASVSTAQVFDVQFGSDMCLNKAFTFGAIFHTFPGLRSLSINAATLPSMLGLKDTDRVPPLRAINFVHCRILGDVLMEELQLATGVKPHIEECIDLSWEEIEWLSCIMIPNGLDR